MINTFSATTAASPATAASPSPDMAALSVTTATMAATGPTTATTAQSEPTVDTLHSSREDGRRLGYIRVSTQEQNEARQVDALQSFGVDKLYMDKQSGKDFARPAYRQLLADLKAGDVLVVKSIDRLGRNYDEILSQWRLITKTKGAAIVVLDMPLLETRNSRDLTGTLIADIVLQLLSYVAETERTFIKQRQREGIAAAKARGQRFGRPDTPRPDNYEEVRELYAAKEISLNEGSKRLGVCFHTFKKWVKQDGVI